MSNIPPGLYPDPQESGKARWWDGAAWGEQRDMPPAPPAPPAPGSSFGDYPAPTGAGYLVVAPGADNGVNKLALWSMISSVGFWWLCGLGWIVGIVLGFVALSQLGQAGNTQRGKGFAIAGVVVGIIFLVFALMLFFTGHITTCPNGVCSMTGATGVTGIG